MIRPARALNDHRSQAARTVRLPIVPPGQAGIQDHFLLKFCCWQRFVLFEHSLVEFIFLCFDIVVGDWLK